MKWYDNTEYVCQKGYARLWMLRRLKGLGASISEMLDVYEKQVRSVLELAVPVWQPALTQLEKSQIERVQRCALYIILGDDYISYDQALELLECDNLEERRVKLCDNFAKKAYTNEKYRNWFTINDEPIPTLNTRSAENRVRNVLKPINTRTDRYQKSPLPYLTNTLNRLMNKVNQ